MSEFTTPELHELYRLVDAGPCTGPRASILEKLALMVAQRAGVRALGDKVYELRLPLSERRMVPARPATPARGKQPARPARPAREVTHAISPTLNVYGSMQTWQRAALYKVIDVRIMAELAKWPRCQLRGDRRPRCVRVTRYSSSQPDEITIDVIGGKVPIDRMVHAGILRGDTAADLQREAMWRQVAPGKGALVIEVFEVGQ